MKKISLTHFLWENTKEHTFEYSHLLKFFGFLCENEGQGTYAQGRKCRDISMIYCRKGLGSIHLPSKLTCPCYIICTKLIYT